jgi:YVTN family beta-propeller protein
VERVGGAVVGGEAQPLGDRRQVGHDVHRFVEWPFHRSARARASAPRLRPASLTSHAFLAEVAVTSMSTPPGRLALGTCVHPRPFQCKIKILGFAASVPPPMADARAPGAGGAALPQVAMAMTPDGRLIYLADYSDSTVTVVRTATNTILKRIHVSFAFSLAVSPDGKTVYAGGADPNTGNPEVVTIATARNTTSRPILLGQDGGVVKTIAVTPTGRTAYFAISSIGNFIVPMRTATRTLGTPIPVGPDPTAIAIARYGSAMYVVSTNNQS